MESNLIKRLKKIRRLSIVSYDHVVIARYKNDVAMFQKQIIEGLTDIIDELQENEHHADR